MTWREHYEELSLKDYSFKSHNKNIFLRVAVALNILFYISFWIFLTTDSLMKAYSSFFLFSIISISFPIITFQSILLPKNNIKIFYNKNNNLFLEFNQKKYLNEKIENINNKQKIFFITWLGKRKEDTKKEDTKLKKAIYFYAYYQYIQYLREYRIDSFTIIHLTKILFFTSIAFWGLMLILTIDYNYIYPNAMFLYSILYVLYIISVSYSVYLQKQQDSFFRENLIGFSEYYFLLDSNLDMYEKEEEKSIDVSAILFGVLFTLYLTLAYNSIYNVGVDIKKISTKIECTNHNPNKKYKEKNNALQ